MADRHILPAPYRLDATAPKLVGAVFRVVSEGGAWPGKLTDIDLCERFGWTLDELDTQDESRVMPGLRLANIRAAIQRVRKAIDGGGLPSGDDLEVYGWAEKVANDA